MHEYSIVSYLVQAVDAEASKLGAERVVAINLVAGERSGIEADSLQFYFDMLAAGTLVNGAALSVRRTPMRMHCATCRLDYVPTALDWNCPHCNQIGQVTDDGSELKLESIEIETPREL
jgi:hydrogenase nickel incorporation protein HypA/HybF